MSLCAAHPPRPCHCSCMPPQVHGHHAALALWLRYASFSVWTCKQFNDCGLIVTLMLVTAANGSSAWPPSEPSTGGESQYPRSSHSTVAHRLIKWPGRGRWVATHFLLVLRHLWVCGASASSLRRAGTTGFNQIERMCLSGAVLVCTSVVVGWCKAPLILWGPCGDARPVGPGTAPAHHPGHGPGRGAAAREPLALQNTPRQGAPHTATTQALQRPPQRQGVRDARQPAAPGTHGGGEKKWAV